MAEELPRRLLADLATLALYGQRPQLNLFELACLAHGAAPEQVARRAWDDVAAHRRSAFGADMEPPTPGDMLALCDASPEMILGDPIGAMLARLKLASGLPTIRASLGRADARRLVEAIGGRLPAELGAGETPEDRRKRRLSRFLDLGGTLRPAGTGWQCTGLRGALAKLVREEQAAGRTMAEKTDVRADLISATIDRKS